MKTKIISITLALFTFSAFSLAAGPRVVNIHTEKRKNAEGKDETFWAPEKIEVVPGEKIEIVAKHETEGGFPIHGLTITPLKVKEQVIFKKTLKLVRDVPADLKAGEQIPATCHLHATHKPATIVVVSKLSGK